MATTNYAVNHPLAVKLYAKDLFHDVIGDSFFGKFMGKGDGNLVQIKTETQKSAGDSIKFGLRTLLTGDGVQGDSTLESAEEALSTYNDTVLINQIRHAVRSAGEMSQQRVHFSVRDEAKDGLQDWWTERLEVCLANQLAGYTAQSDTKFTGNNATIAPTATYRIICGGSAVAGAATAEGSLSATTTHAIKLADLDRAVALAKAPQVVGGTTYQRIRPLKIDGKSMYVAFLHPWQILQLRKDASTAGNFFDIQKAAMQGGKYSDNPIVNGGNFIYNNVIVHEWSYLPNIVTTPASGAVTDYRRGVFCGAQAATVAFGQNSGPTKMTWVEELFDYDNQLGVAAGMIFGVKKTVFNSVDFATIVMSGYAPAP
jgi:N4-gp56 family major capsid protein